MHDCITRPRSNHFCVVCCEIPPSRGFFGLCVAPWGDFDALCPAVFRWRKWIALVPPKLSHECWIVEPLLLERGCPKLNIQVRATNTEVLEFYRRIGYARDEAVSFGKRLIPDEPAA